MQGMFLHAGSFYISEKYFDPIEHPAAIDITDIRHPLIQEEFQDTYIHERFAPTTKVYPLVTRPHEAGKSIADDRP